MSKARIKVLDEQPIQGKVFRLAELGPRGDCQRSLCVRFEWSQTHDEWSAAFYKYIDHATHDRDRLTSVPHDLAHLAVKALDMLREHAAAECLLRRCRVCGCTDDDCRQCIEKTGEPCGWVEWDLCSACVPGAEGSSL